MGQHLLWDLGERAVRHFNSTFGSSRIANRAYPGWPTCNRDSTEGLGQGRSTPEASSHSLYLIKLFDCSYPEGNFGGNQLLDIFEHSSPSRRASWRRRTTPRRLPSRRPAACGELSGVSKNAPEDDGPCRKEHQLQHSPPISDRATFKSLKIRRYTAPYQRPFI